MTAWMTAMWAAIQARLMEWALGPDGEITVNGNRWSVRTTETAGKRHIVVKRERVQG